MGYKAHGNDYGGVFISLDKSGLDQVRSGGGITTSNSKIRRRSGQSGFARYIWAEMTCCLGVISYLIERSTFAIKFIIIIN